MPQQPGSSAISECASPTLTDEQLRAVSLRGVSAAVSAGAGSGKTSVLTERFLKELHPEKAAGRRVLSRLAAITFTERAAREMRDRIRDACRKKLLACPEAEVDYWLGLLRELEEARISTIHSFCAALLRSRAVEAGLDPHFSVLEAAQTETLLYKTTDNILRRRLADGDEEAINLVTLFGLERLQTIIFSLLNHRREIAWSAWLDLDAEQLAARWKAFFEESYLPQALQRIKDLPEARTLLRLAAARVSTHQRMQQRFDQLREHLADLHRREQLDLVSEAAAVQYVHHKHWTSKEAYEQFREAAEVVRKEISKITALGDFTVEALRPAAARALQAFRLAAAVADAYEDEKRALAALDFDDLLLHAKRVLTKAENAKTPAHPTSQLQLLLVDELQDTESLQVELIKALCDGNYHDGKLFVVGDCQQSIYRFRGAEPQVFRELCAEIPPEGRTPLTINFRSQPAILEFVNALFSEELGADYQPLRPARPQLGPKPAVELLLAIAGGEREYSFEEESFEEPEKVDAAACRRCEAEWLARRIRELLESGEKLVVDREEKSLRAVKPGDIAILFRALTDVEHYEEALQRHGIDYYLVGGRAFYAQQEIYDVLNLLRAIHSRCDEVSLTGVLRSPMFGLYDETLFFLARHPQGLAAGLFAEKPPPELSAEQRRRTLRAAETLRRLRAIKDRLPVAHLLQEALRLTAYDATLAAEFLGERKLANLHKLIDQARSFDRAGEFHLADFITQLAEFVARLPEEPPAATQPETTEVLKLMTIHQAKGLEFPVVFVPDLSRPLNPQKPAAAFHPKLGPLLPDPETISGFELFTELEKQEEQAESMRLFYVATTRAADYLILSAGIKQPHLLGGFWLKLLDKRFDLQSGKPRQSAAQNESPTLLKVTFQPRPEEDERVRGRHHNLPALVKKAQRLAKAGQGCLPRYLAPVSVKAGDRREFSFSRIDGELMKLLPESETPWAVGRSLESAAAARNLGTFVHAVLAQLDFAHPEHLRKLCLRLTEQYLPYLEQPPEEAIQMIERFLASPRAEEMTTAKELYREMEFLMAWPPEGCSEAPGAILSPAGRRYFRGFIDCLYLDKSNHWHLVDYKTVFVSEESLSAVAARFVPQMWLYALAAEKVWKTAPAELVVYFLPSGLEWQVPWDAGAKEQLVETINRVLPEDAS